VVLFINTVAFCITPIPLLTSPLKGEERSDFPPLQGGVKGGNLLLQEKVVLGQKLLKDLRLFGDVFDRLLAV
jgi:hypothetical protein